MKIAVIGDIHLLFSEADATYFNGSDHDLLLFVGDIYNYSPRRGLEVAAELARLDKPALLIPGNHDAAHPTQLAAELTGRSSLIKITGWGHAKRVKQLESIVGGVNLTGFAVHELGEDLSLVAARPHSMGGQQVAFAPYLQSAYGISDMSESAQRLRELVDQCKGQRLIFLAHNGPVGLGDRRHDIWGCDFRKEEGDHGDEDLREAIEYATAQGKRVISVIAGHMHHRLRGGGTRSWSIRRDGILHINAARVPRIFREKGATYHHHIDLHVKADSVEAVEVLRET